MKLFSTWIVRLVCISILLAGCTQPVDQPEPSPTPMPLSESGQISGSYESIGSSSSSLSAWLNQPAFIYPNSPSESSAESCDQEPDLRGVAYLESGQMMFSFEFDGEVPEGEYGARVLSPDGEELETYTCQGSSEYPNRLYCFGNPLTAGRNVTVQVFGGIAGIWGTNGTAYEDPIVAYEDPIVAYEDPIVAYEDPIVAFEPPVFREMGWSSLEELTLHDIYRGVYTCAGIAQSGGELSEACELLLQNSLLRQATCGDVYSCGYECFKGFGGEVNSFEDLDSLYQMALADQTPPTLACADFINRARAPLTAPPASLASIAGWLEMLNLSEASVYTMLTGEMLPEEGPKPGVWDYQEDLQACADAIGYVEPIAKNIGSYRAFYNSYLQIYRDLLYDMPLVCRTERFYDWVETFTQYEVDVAATATAEVYDPFGECYEYLSEERGIERSPQEQTFCPAVFYWSVASQEDSSNMPPGCYSDEWVNYWASYNRPHSTMPIPAWECAIALGATDEFAACQSNAGDLFHTWFTSYMANLLSSGGGLGDLPPACLNDQFQQWYDTPWLVAVPDGAFTGRPPYSGYGSLSTFDCIENPEAFICGDPPEDGYFFENAETCASQINWAEPLDSYGGVARMVSYLSALAPWLGEGSLSDQCALSVGYVVQHHPSGYWGFMSDLLNPVQPQSCSPTLAFQIPAKIDQVVEEPESDGCVKPPHPNPQNACWIWYPNDCEWRCIN